MKLLVLSVNAALPSVIGTDSLGAPVLSAIAKRPFEEDQVMVNQLGLSGDGQADLVNHGGIDKAVYAYSADHWSWWQDEHGLACGPGRFGENLTLMGATEMDIHIGDRFQWGEAVLEVSQPRQPCFKFQIYSQRPDASALMTSSARCGWYLRVVKPGNVPVQGASLHRIQQGDGASVRDTFLAAFLPNLPAEKRTTIALAPALAEAWRHAITRKN
jgi:MOSC domain-containing protein YiiM